MEFHKDILKVDYKSEVERICSFIQRQVRAMKRDGIVIGLSGGVDSAVMSTIAVQAVGQDNVVGLVLPENESNPISRQYAVRHAEALGIEFREIDITPTVDSVVSYSWRDEYIKKLVPGYNPGCKYNIILPTDLLDRDSFNFYVLQVKLNDGTVEKKRLNPQEFRTITSFASIKIRARMIHLYAEAERRSLVVAGTTNRTEFILGDFCKYGDGGTDIEALAHLYKNQVYQLAGYLNVIPEICEREPSPDTFSLPVNDQEFFFRIPFDKLDFLLYAWEHQVPLDQTSKVLGLSNEAVGRAFKDFVSKNLATQHLREMAYSLD
ncbi:NAD(+) synthase [Planctomycetota bacterium]